MTLVIKIVEVLKCDSCKCPVRDVIYQHQCRNAFGKWCGDCLKERGQCKYCGDPLMWLKTPDTIYRSPPKNLSSQMQKLNII